MYTPMPSFELLRAHYGDNCWWCDQPIDFTLKPANPKSATREHLQPIKRHGGTNEIANLRICHKHCNQHLANHDRATKERMRGEGRDNPSMK